MELWGNARNIYQKHLPVHLSVSVLCAVLLSWVFANKAVGGGLSFSTSAENVNMLFSWHPLLLIFAFGALMAESVVGFRLWNTSHERQKKLHAVLQTLVFLCAAFGYAAIEVFKSATGSSRFYSVHSYVGAVSLLLLLAQYGLGFIFYGLKGLVSMETKKKFMKLHKTFGITLFIAGTGAIMTGLSTKQGFFVPAEGHYAASVFHTNFVAVAHLLVVASVIWVMIGAPIPPVPADPNPVEITAVAKRSDTESAAMTDPSHIVEHSQYLLPVK